MKMGNIGPSPSRGRWVGHDPEGARADVLRWSVRPPERPPSGSVAGPPPPRGRRELHQGGGSVAGLFTDEAPCNGSHGQRWRREHPDGPGQVGPALAEPDSVGLAPVRPGRLIM